MPFFLRTPSGRLKDPKLNGDNPDRGSSTHNAWMQPMAKVQDYVLVRRSVSAGTVGVVTSVTPADCELGPGCTVELLDGSVSRHWLWYMRTIPREAVDEVIAFYVVEEKRPERIKNTLK